MNNGPLYDQARLKSLVDAAGADGAKQLISTLWTSVDDIAAALKTGVSDASADAIKASAHSLRGCAGNVGAVRLSEIAQQIEDGAQVNMDGLPALLIDLDTAISASKATVDALIDDLQ